MTKQSDNLDQILPALIAAQAEFPAITKDGYNPHFKSRFATLKAVKEATLPVLGRHDLGILQFPSAVDGKPALTTWLVHKSGQYIADTTALSMVKQDPQAQGSALTYLRRYGWSAVLGLVTDEDDDANSATLPDRPVQPASIDIEGAKAKLRAAIKSAGLTKEQASDYAWVADAKATPEDYEKVMGAAAAFSMGKAI